MRLCTEVFVFLKYCSLIVFLSSIYKADPPQAKDKTVLLDVANITSVYITRKSHEYAQRYRQQ